MKSVLRLFAMVAVMSCAAFAYAGDGDIPTRETIEKDQPGLTLDSLSRHTERAQQEIDKKSDLEDPENGISTVTYNDDGTINLLTYKDGTTVTYSYERGQDGSLDTCTLDSRDTVMVFEKIQGDAGKARPGDVAVKVYAKDPSAKGRRELNADKVITLYYPKESLKLEDVARKPVMFDLKEIKASIAKASGLKDGAFREYQLKASLYYQTMEKKLRETVSALGKENIDSRRLLEGIDKEGATVQEKRAAIDEAVNHIREEAARDGHADVVREVLDFEKTMRDQVLMPGQALYEAGVTKALESINKAIDRLLASRLALYLNVDARKDKIDVIINLPEAKDQNNAQASE